MFSLGMSRIDEATIAKTILCAPGWARVGITAPNDRLRDDAAAELARIIIEEIGEPVTDASDANQLKLSL